MDIMEVIRSRHSVRKFQDTALEKNAIDALNKEIELCNMESIMLDDECGLVRDCNRNGNRS